MSMVKTEADTRMLEYIKGNILESNCECIVNAVNCRGVMGRGLARAFREHFKDVYYKHYQDACDHNELELGKIHSWKNPNPKPVWVVNFPTMVYPGERTGAKTLKDGLQDLEKFILDNKIYSIALPALGCGIGRFPWLEFKKIIEDFSNRLPETRVVVYEPHERC